MVTFDASLPGTPVSTWDDDPRLHDRPALSLEGVGELVVIAAHPDDETLGAGGLIAVCARRGIPVTVVVVTDGGASHSDVPGLVQQRQAELAAAIGVLAPGAGIVHLGLPDGATREHRDDVARGLEPIISGSSPSAMIATPWRGDGHRDHRIVGEVSAELAHAASRALIEYPVWLWHWAEPDDERTPWNDLVALGIDRDTKRRALAEYGSQTEGDAPVLRPDFLAHFDRDTEFFVRGGEPEPGDQPGRGIESESGGVDSMETGGKPEGLHPEPEGLHGDYFDETYSRHDDPWGFETRWYEARKRAVTLASLPAERYSRVLEIGCSIGVLTDALADRSDDLLAVDVSQAAVDRAQARVGGRARVERADILTEFPAGEWDLVLLSEVGYYFSRPELERVLDAIERGLADGGTLLACHWRHPVADYPLGGDEVHARLRARGIPVVVTHIEEDFVLEVFARDGRSVARRTGLA